MYTFLKSTLIVLGLATFVAPCSAALFNQTKSQEPNSSVIELGVAPSSHYEVKTVKKYKPHQAQNYVYRERSLGKGFAYLLGSLAALGSIIALPEIWMACCAPAASTPVAACANLMVGIAAMGGMAIIMIPVAIFLLYKSIVAFRGEEVVVEGSVPSIV